MLWEPFVIAEIKVHIYHKQRSCEMPQAAGPQKAVCSHFSDQRYLDITFIVIAAQDSYSNLSL